ncbi:MAG: arsenite efflux transporter metallochaperone ArsD [Christensenellales bacterium]
MKKMVIYEPAMCCPTGLCGVGVDPELLRISTVLNFLKKNGVAAERFNLSNAPQEFIKNTDVNRMINEKGINVLPVTVVDGRIVKTGKYPTNDEIVSLLGVPRSFLGEEQKAANATGRAQKPGGGCGCGGGDCCR